MPCYILSMKSLVIPFYEGRSGEIIDILVCSSVDICLV